MGTVKMGGEVIRMCDKKADLPSGIPLPTSPSQGRSQRIPDSEVFASPAKGVGNKGSGA